MESPSNFISPLQTFELRLNERALGIVEIQEGPGRLFRLVATSA